MVPSAAATSMLTKLVRSDDVDPGNTATPLVWRRNLGPVSAVPSAQHIGNTVRDESPSGPPAVPMDSGGILQAQIAELNATMERRVREARDSAYREGEAAGRNQAVAEVQPVLDRLAKSIQELAALKPKLRHEAESDVVKLALAIAKKILHRELSIDPDSIAGLIKASIEKIRTQEILKVRIHPQHQPALQQMLARIAVGNQIEILADPKLQPGTLIVETARGKFDASIDLQLREIERGLTDRLASHR
jgi:flagellar assembly protein FliH